MGYTDYIQTKLDELSNGVDQSIVRDDLFLNNWQNDKLVRPVDLYNNKGVKLYSISLNDQSVVPNIILGERQDKTDRPAIRPSNWLSMTYVNDKGKLIEGKFPIFYPYIKIMMAQGVLQLIIMYTLLQVINKQLIQKPDV